MITILSLFKNRFYKRRSLDIILMTYRTFLWVFFGFVVTCLFLVAVFTFLRIQVNEKTFIALYIINFLAIFTSLYFGLWNTRLTSRQIYILFDEKKKQTEVKREKNILKFIRISAIIAIIGGVNIFMLTLNNYLMVAVNKLYVLADLVISYGVNGESLWYLKPLIGNQLWNSFFMVVPAIFVPYLLYNSYKQELVPYYDLMKSKIRTRFYKNGKLASLFIDAMEKEKEVTIKLGVNSETGEPVILTAENLRLNMSIAGPIGSGKSTAFAKVIIIQLAEQSIEYFRAFHEFIQKQKKVIKKKRITSEEEKQRLFDEWFTKGMGSKYTNGFFVNEPTGELVADAYDILKRVGIPDEMINFVNLDEEDTASVNIFDGSSEEVAGSVADLIKNFSEDGGSGGNVFFTNAEYAFAKNLAWLIKITSRIESSYLDKGLLGNSPSWSEFYRHLENTETLIDRIAIMEVYLNAIKRKYEKEYNIPYQETYEKELKIFLSNGGRPERFNAYRSKELVELSNKRRDMKSEVEIAEGVYNYFAHAFVTDKMGNEFFTHDTNIAGMKNTVRNMASSKKVRRIFFNSGSFDIDIVMKHGGFVLFSSGQGSIDDTASRMIGKIADKIVQNAVFRRDPKTKEAFFGIIEDEYNWITTKQTENFLNKNRKYNTGVIGMYQNYDQIVATIGRDAVESMLNSYRNLFVFQGGSNKTYEQIVERAGKKKIVTRTINSGTENLLAGNDNNSTSYREQIEEVDTVTSTDLFRLEQFQFAGIMVQDDEETELIKVTPVPAHELDILKDGGKNHHKLFDIENNEYDRQVFNTWMEQIERRYRLKFRDETIPLSMFNEQEQEIILGKNNHFSELGNTPNATKDRAIIETARITSSIALDEQIISDEDAPPISEKEIETTGNVTSQIIKSKAKKIEEETISEILPEEIDKTNDGEEETPVNNYFDFEYVDDESI